MKRLSLLFIFSFLFVSHAGAVMFQPQKGFLIEPILGFSMGKFQIDDVFDEEKFTGPSFGARLGYQNKSLQYGIDFMKSSVKIDDKSFKDNLSLTEWGPFVGYEFPVLFRLYAAFILSAEGKVKLDNGQDLEFLDGKATKFGVGYTGFSLVNIIFEYKTGTFDNFSIGGSKGNIEASYNSYMLGVSIPFIL